MMQERSLAVEGYRRFANLGDEPVRPAMPDVQNQPCLPEISDEDLLRAYCAFDDHEHLTTAQQEIVEELERREIEL